MDVTANKINAGSPNIPEGQSAQQVAASGPISLEKGEKRENTSGKAQSVNSRYIEELTEKIQKHLESKSINIAFSRYGKKGENISVLVTEKKTGEIIREIPPEELQRLSIKMDELRGIIFNDHA